MDFEGGRPPNFSENNKKKQFLWLSSCWFTTFATPLGLPFLGGASHQKMTTNAVVLPPSTHSEAHLVQDLHNDLTKKRTAYEWYTVFIHIIYISWQRLSSYGTQAPHKWSMVITCYNSIYRGCNQVARLFSAIYRGPFLPF